MMKGGPQNALCKREGASLPGASVGHSHNWLQPGTSLRTPSSSTSPAVSQQSLPFIATFLAGIPNLRALEALRPRPRQV